MFTRLTGGSWGAWGAWGAGVAGALRVSDEEFDTVLDKRSATGALAGAALSLVVGVGFLIGLNINK